MKTFTNSLNKFRLLVIFSTFTFAPYLSFSQTISNANLFIENDASKLKNGLQAMLKVKQDQRAGITPNNNLLINFDNALFSLTEDSIVVDAIAENEGITLVNDLKALNITVIAHYGKLVTCWIAFDKLTVFEKIKSCRWVEPAPKPLKNSGIVQSQGDAGQRSDIARTMTGLNGAGVKIGVLSDSYNHKNGASTGVTNGELPGVGNPNGLTTPVTVLQEMPGTTGSDEGRAMLEIVHDVAPNAQLYFHTAYSSEADFANGITALANAGCKVIIDDIIYFAEAFYQDDIVAQAVNNVKTNSGVTYFSSAINSKNYSYENGFQQGGNVTINSLVEIKHNFGTVDQPVTFLPITIPTSSSVIFNLQWNQPFFSISGGSGATTDLNIYLVNNLNTIVAYNNSNNIGNDASSYFTFTNSTANTTFYLLITKKSGPDPTKIKFVVFRNSSSLFNNTPAVVGLYGSTTYGHPNADGAISTGAANFDDTPAFGTNPPLIATYSSYGGTPILFDQSGASIGPIIRNKPEIVAPDGANNSFFGSDSDNDADAYPNFFGTSAAAPHAGAVAALMLQAKPGATPDEIKTALINSCIDMGTPGFDFISGNGLIRADEAILSLYSVTANAPAITTLCLGANISITFSSVGTFGVANQYKLQLSNSSGSFSAPTDIGTLTSTANSGTINGVIPSGATPGAGYKLRIIASTPSKNSNEIAVSLNAIPSAPSPNPNSRCGPGTVILTASGCGGGTIKWFANATATTVLATGGTYTTPSISSNTTYYVDCTVSTCVSSKNSITATVNTQPSAPTTTPGSRCGTGSVTLIASGCAGGTIKWFGNATATTVLATGGTYNTPSISTNTTYYADCVLGTCNNKASVLATVNIDVSFSSPTQLAGTYRASQTISSGSNVANPTNYYAGKAITLTPGFQAGASEIFLASIQGCP